MTSIFEEREEEAVRAVAARYKGRGYDVVIRPDTRSLPRALKKFQPDLLARNDAENVVVEIKSKATLSHATGLKQMAQSVESMPGWRFELVVVNPELQTSVPTRGQTLPRAQIIQRLEEAKALGSKGHVSAAFLMAWSAAEAVLRRIASKEGIDSSGYSPPALFKELYSIGAISRKAYETFVEAVRIRNSLVHGFKVSETTAPILDRLLGTVDRLLQELNSTRAATPPESGRRGRRTSTG